MNVEDEHAWELLRADRSFQGVVDEAKALGVRIVPEGQLERRI